MVSPITPAPRMTRGTWNLESEDMAPAKRKSIAEIRYETMLNLGQVLIDKK
jgi:hypothetical protein